MSRTDKDQPTWILSEYWEPHHDACQYVLRRYGQRTCDLPAEPVRQRPPRWRYRGLAHRACYWRPTWDQYHKPWGTLGVPTWYVRMEFTRPGRRRTRDELTRARQEYRATGEVDTIASTTQHRHRARWDWH